MIDPRHYENQRLQRRLNEEARKIPYCLVAISRQGRTERPPRRLTKIRRDICGDY